MQAGTISRFNAARNELDTFDDTIGLHQRYEDHQQDASNRLLAVLIGTLGPA